MDKHSAEQRLDQALVPFTPDWTVHPGEILREWIEEAGSTEAATARATQIPLDRLSAILNGHAGIDLGIAQRLADHTGISLQLWINLQATYDTFSSRSR